MFRHWPVGSSIAHLIQRCIDICFMYDTKNEPLGLSYTLLVPSDSAITSKGYSWPRLLAERGVGNDLLDRHTISGTWYSEGLLSQRTLTTLAGTSVTFRRDLDGKLYNSF